MGIERRLSGVLARCGVLAVLGVTVIACNRPSAPDPAAEQRRPLLQPPDRAALAREEAQRAALFDASGKLLASDQTVAELVLPRGLQPAGASDRLYRFFTDKVPFEALDHYFAERLLTGQLERPTPGSVRFVWATIKAASHAPLVTVRVMRLAGDRKGCDVLIEQASPLGEALTVEQAAALTKKQLESTSR